MIDDATMKRFSDRPPGVRGVISQNAFVRWERYDPDTLAEYVKRFGRIRVRVQVPRQVRREGTLFG